MRLYNIKNGKELKEEMLKSSAEKVTLSFYKYIQISDPQLFRDKLYTSWEALGIMGRTYVAQEGINAQISVPKEQFAGFQGFIEAQEWGKDLRLNIAVEAQAKSFFKLSIKIRPKIVADGLDDSSFDPSNTGIHLNAESFNSLTAQEDTVIVDMRNHYESEVGHFEKAICPDVDTFRESLPIVEEILEEHRNKHIVMYCTGGIRCEKASAYFKHKGFEKVYQLEGGIINYAREVQTKGLPNKFKGKNFVFDERLGERITDDVISNCHQCGAACDTHTNCKNVMCNLLFIQCESCAKKYEGCCSNGCQDFTHLSEEDQLKQRKGQDSGVRIFSKGRFNQNVGPTT